LHTVVHRITSVRVFDYIAEVAIRVSYGISKLIGAGRTWHIRRGAGGKTRGNELGKSVGEQRGNVRVSVDFVEIMYVVISDITNFRRHLAVDLPLAAHG